MKDKLNIIIAGQKQFAVDTYKICAAMPFVKVVGVLTPKGEKHLTYIAQSDGIPVFTELPHLEFDLGITAHYFGRIQKSELEMASIGWIGYHPSLLPRHRGRNSILATIQSGDIITGGTIYWLDSKFDNGAIALQEFVFRDSDNPLDLWVNTLAPLGIKLINKVLLNIDSGIIARQNQCEKHVTVC